MQSKNRGLGNFKVARDRTARVTSKGTTSQLLAIARTQNVEITLKLGAPDMDAPDDWGPNMFLNVQSGARYVSFALCTQTAAELEAIKNLLNLALDTALEVAVNRDRIAEEEARQGDHSLQRLHRGVPVFIIREGLKPEHDPCVCDRRAVIPLGKLSPGTDSRDSTDGIPSSDVAQPQPPDLGTANDDAEDHES